MRASTVTATRSCGLVLRSRSVSWLVQNDVDSGHRDLNFTKWNLPQHPAKDVAELVKGGDMQPWYYLPTHPAAKLSNVEKTLGPQAEPEKH
jgi:hypothetical protein